MGCRGTRWLRQTKEELAMFDILMYLFENYVHSEAEVLVDHDQLTDELLKAGFAWHFIKYNKSPGLAQLESDARSNRVGLWQLSNPTPPWDFRKN